MSGDDDGDGEAGAEPPRTFVEPFLEHERAARGVLDELEADLLVGEAEHVRERLREMAHADHDTLLTLCLCCDGNDQFFEDIAEQFDDDMASRLRPLGEFHDQLAREFRIVCDQVDMGRENPVTGVSFSGPTANASRCRSSATSSTPAASRSSDRVSHPTNSCRSPRSSSEPPPRRWRTPSRTRTPSTPRS